MRRITKLFNIDIKSIDEANRKVTFCFSDDSEDRQGEIVDQASWDVKNYESNPIILWGHDPSEPENVLGQGVELDLNNGGKSYITAQFDDAETNPKADMVFRQLVKRTLRCVSAGFISRKETREAGVPVLRDNELLEVSIVPIPANPRAIALALKDGSLSDKDAKWLQVSMKKELEYIEKQLEQDKEETPVSAETDKAMLAAIESLTKGFADLSETVKAGATAKGLVADVVDADHSWEIEDEKWDLIKPVCALFYALQEAWYFSTTPLDAFNELVSEFATLVAAVADGSYNEKTASGNEALAKALDATKGVDVKAFITKAAEQPVADEHEDDDESNEDVPEDKADDEITDGTDSKKKSQDDQDDDHQDDADDDESADDNAEEGQDVDDELDLDAELTDELKEKIDAEIVNLQSTEE